MKRFVLLHFGFKEPTPEIMDAWHAWFDGIKDLTIENGGFRSGREISKGGTMDLPWGMESITGYTMIRAENLDGAEAVARSCPFIAGIRIYEIR